MNTRRSLRTALFACAAVGTLCGVLTATASAQQSIRGGGILSALEREVRELVETVSPSVVTIRSACKQTGTPSHPGPSSLSIGSGLILDTVGRIITTAGVVDNADEFWVETFDERIFPAVLIGVSGDVAVLQIEATRLAPARLGDATELGVGSFVAAVGNSYGFACGLAWGEVNGFRPDGTIQLSLGVSAGSSGGAIVDTRGHVVGLVKAKISEPYYIDAPGAAGASNVLQSRRLELPTSSVSLAIPIGTALRLARNLTDPGLGAPAYVGVYVEDLSGWQAAHFKTSEGVLVIGVVDGSPADRYGLASGDIIRAVGTEDIPSVRRFRQVIVQSQPGERLTFDILREGRPLKVTLEMAKAEMLDLSEPVDPIPVHAARSLPIITPSAAPANASLTSSPVGVKPQSIGEAQSQRPSSRETDLRLRMLERAVDSLMREIQTLRLQHTP